jgi:putative membrane protein
MVRFILRGLVAAVGFWVASWLGLVTIHGLAPLIVAGLLLGIVNAIVRPIVTLLTLPITIITLGLFLFVVNAFSLYVVSWVVNHLPLHGTFHIGHLLHAILAVIVIWAVSLVANMFLGGEVRPVRR